MAAKTITANGNAQISTAQFKFGTGSGLFDGTGDYLSTPDSADWNFGTNNFCIEAWIRPTGSRGVICGQYQDATNWMGFIYNYNISALGFGSLVAGAWGINISIPFTPTLDFTFYHVVVTRTANTGSASDWHMFVNGVEGTKTLNVGSYTCTLADYAGSFVVGTLFGNFEFDYNGYIDELRVVNGTAVYTANFTPPTSAYYGNSSPNTKLLLHMDGTNGSTTFLDSEDSVMPNGNFFLVLN